MPLIFLERTQPANKKHIHVIWYNCLHYIITITCVSYNIYCLYFHTQYLHKIAKLVVIIFLARQRVTYFLYSQHFEQTMVYQTETTHTSLQCSVTFL